MRSLKFMMSAIALLLSLPAEADTASDKTAFNEAFRSYKSAMTNGDTEKALEGARKAYEIGKALFGPEHKNTAVLALNYGRLLKDDEAEAMLHEALDLHKKIYGPGAFELIDPLMDLAAEHTKFGRLGNAKRYYGQALEIAKAHKGEQDRIVGIINMEIGQVALADAQSHEAIRYLKHAEDIFAAIDGEDAEIRLAQTRFWIGKYRLADNSEKAATEALLAALTTFERVAPNAPITLTNHAFLVEAYERRGMRAEATKHCRAIGSAKPVDPDQDFKPIFRRPPEYPSGAVEGVVIVSLTVDEDGYARNPFVVEQDGSDRLVRAALEATESFRYVPRFENGEPVKTADVKYRFVFNYAD
jgi:TonB family protein